MGQRLGEIYVSVGRGRETKGEKYETGCPVTVVEVFFSLPINIWPPHTSFVRRVCAPLLLPPPHAYRQPNRHVVKLRTVGSSSFCTRNRLPCTPPSVNHYRKGGLYLILGVFDLLPALGEVDCGMCVRATCLKQHVYKINDNKCLIEKFINEWLKYII